LKHRPSSPIKAFNALRALHPFVVNPIGARQSQHARKYSTPTEEGKPPRNEKDKDEDWGELGS